MRRTQLGFLVVALTGAIVAGSLLLTRNPASFYPYVVIGGPGDLKLTFLQHGRLREADCESSTTNTINLLQSACRDCSPEKKECVKELSAEQKKLLSEVPLDVPSVRLRNGVVTYSAPNSEDALNACRESDRQSAKAGGRLICYEAGTTRPLSASEADIAPRKLNRLPAAIALGAGAIALAFILLYGRMHLIVTALIAWPRHRKRLLIAVVDILCIEATLWLAFALRLEVFYVPLGDSILLFALAPIIALPILVGFGLYRSIIRYLGMQAIIAIAKAVVVYVGLLALALNMLAFEGIPGSTLAIHGILAFLAIGATRAFARSWLMQARGPVQLGSGRKRVVIYGAGSAGIQLATALNHSKELKPVGFLDDDSRLHRSRMGELEVFPPLHLPDLIARYDVKEILLAIPSASRHRRNEIINLLEPLPVQVRTLPGLSDLVEGKVKTDDLREIDIEDLLGRDAVEPNAELLRTNITGKSVMVTGAGGSIGAELCRQIQSLKPKFLVLYEQSEFSLYRVMEELGLRTAAASTSDRHSEVIPLLGSVTNENRLAQVITRFGVETIFHAAAYKHVPIVENNPCEGVFNNIFGTYRTAKTALENGVEAFVLISTDKAVRPTNTMGTTKRFAEMILQAFAHSEMPTASRTRFSIVRFGNVLGSSGSVVPLFREQIRRGGPVTVTDPRIVRYFMTIPEATQLVIQAGAMGKDGEVFVLDMGEPVKILDLAHRMIHLSGLQVKDAANPSGDIEVVFSGLRPGEKLYEELLIGQSSSPTGHPRIMRAGEKMLPMEVINRYLERLLALVDSGNSDGIRSLLLEAVEEFQPQCGNEDLTQTGSRSQAIKMSFS